MQELRELQHLVSHELRWKIDRPPSQDARGSSQFGDFARGLEEGLLTSDHVAASMLCNAQPSAPRYRILKSRFRRKLLSALFFVKIEKAKSSAYARAYYHVQRVLFWSKTCLMFGARNVSVQLAEEGLRTSRRFNLTMATLEFEMLLRSHHALLGLTRTYRKYHNDVESSIRVLDAEQRTTQLLDQVTMAFARSSAAHPQLVELTGEALSAVESIRTERTSFTIEMNYFRLSIFHHQIAQQFERTLEICDEALDYFSRNPQFHSDQRVAQFYLDKLESYLYLRDYANGKIAATECMRCFRKGSNNWFIFMEFYFLLALHTKQFVEAGEVFREATSHARFSFQPPHRQEKWEVFQFYLRYVQGVIGRDAREWRGRTIKDFLDIVPTYAKDKHGLNISILIIHILYLLDAGDRDAIIQRMDALRTYRTRYLRTKINQQSALFFNMLQIVESSSFEYARIVQRTKPLYTKLVASTANYTEINEGLQILPFDWLWQHVLERVRLLE